MGEAEEKQDKVDYMLVVSGIRTYKAEKGDGECEDYLSSGRRVRKAWRRRWHLNKDLMEVREGSMPRHGGRAVQTQGRASAKAQGQEQMFTEHLRKPVRLEQSEEGGSGSRLCRACGLWGGV